MSWPTDDLTNTHLDQGTGDPSLARPELNALLLKVQAILAEVTAGAKVWHSANDGTGSGLDADTLDGKHLSEIPNKVMFTGFAQSPVVAATTRYSNISGRNAGQAIESNTVREIIPFQPGITVVTVKDFFVRAGANSTVGNTIITLLKNGNTTGISITYPAGSNTSLQSDKSNTITYSPTTDLLSISWMNNGASGTLDSVSWGFTVEE